VQSIAIFFLIGLFLKYLKIEKIDIAKMLNLGIIYLSLPALILYKIPSLHFSKDAYLPLFIPWIITPVLAVSILFLSKKFHFTKQETGSLLLVGVLGNTSFLGVPFINFFYGERYVPYALLYDQLGSFLILSTYGSVIVSIYGIHHNRGILQIVKKIIFFPPFLSLVIGFTLSRFYLTDLVAIFLKPISQTLVPFALMSVGYQLHFSLPKEERKPLIVAIIVKLILSPLLAFSIIFLFFDLNTISKVTILEAGMGPMITAGIMATLAGLNPRLTNAIVGYGILSSFITLPLFFKLLSYF